MIGSLGKIIGIPIFEDKTILEGTYQCLDQNNLPIPVKDLETATISKILVPNIETFKIAMKNNGVEL